jgi:hypothetical protein
MMLVRYQGQVAGFVGATRYTLAAHRAGRPATDVDRRRMQAVREWALEVRRLTGSEPGRRLREHPRDR